MSSIKDKGADLILRNGNIITVNPRIPRCEALAIRDKRIVKIGSKRELDGHRGSEVIDLRGKTVVPGFIDGHQHLLSYGITIKTWVDAYETNSSQEIVEKVAERARSYPKEKWIAGRGWTKEKLRDNRLPTRWELDKVAPDNPVTLKDISGHYCIANTKALNLAGVNKNTPQPKNGYIDRDFSSGEPNGILRETAMNYIWDIVPQPTWEELVEGIKLGCQHANSLGLTSVHNCPFGLPWAVGYTAEEIKAYVDLNLRGELSLKNYLLISVWEHFHRGSDTIMLDHLLGLGLKTGFGDSMLKIGPAKIFVDGSLNARSAALYEPYSDDPSTSGMMFYTQEQLDNVIEKAHKAGIQLAIHAHGDRAIDSALNSLERAMKKFPQEDHRHRIKHVELLSDEQISRIKKLGLIVTSIPSTAGFSPWYQEMARTRVGDKRAEFLHRYKDLMDHGVVISGGTDGHPAGKYLSPLQGLRDRVAVVGFTLDQALAIQTINSAFAAFEENEKGTIEEGKVADLVVLDEDPYAVNIDEISEIRVEKTILSGKVVFDNPCKT